MENNDSSTESPESGRVEQPENTTASSPIAQMRAITLSREYGSGGGEIAARLAKRLGWQLIDHEIVVRVAQELGVHEEVIASHDEYGDPLLVRLLASLRVVQPVSSVNIPALPETDALAYQDALTKVVTAAVTAGQVVIVGRGSQVLLAGRRDTLHVRIVASLNRRVAYVMEREGLNNASARARIQLKDRDRMRYLEATHRCTPADAHLYDLVLNTDVLSLDSVVALIAQALEFKAAQFATPDDQLGPGAGLTQYTQQPADFRPPESLAPEQESEQH
ncbi:MAG TPA: cytidylate kinase-like family protein [Ktedonobacterales bacterium]|nr:cytidylate kinase-like family protein [Ktedonobacterales bacterium]